MFDVKARRTWVGASPLSAAFLRHFYSRFPDGAELGPLAFQNLDGVEVSSKGLLSLSGDESIVWNLVDGTILFIKGGQDFYYHPLVFFRSIRSKLSWLERGSNIFDLPLTLKDEEAVPDGLLSRRFGPTFLSGLVRTWDYPMFAHYVEKWGSTGFTAETEQNILRRMRATGCDRHCLKLFSTELRAVCERVGFNSDFLDKYSPAR